MMDVKCDGSMLYRNISILLLTFFFFFSSEIQNLSMQCMRASVIYEENPKNKQIYHTN